MKKIQSALLIVTLVNLVAVISVIAQTEELILKMSRDFGYGGFNNDIQGLFSMKVTGPADIVRVIFFIDSTNIGEVSQLPFNLQFNTDNYPIGQHELYAVGFSSNGKQYGSNVITSNFVPASVGNKAALQIAVPMLVIVFGAILLSFVVPLLTGRVKTQKFPLGEERKYGHGGGICPKCQRPFALSLFSMNLGFSKLARCPYCGKWSVLRVQPLMKLREAEQAELVWGNAVVQEETEEERLHKELEDSKYQGL
jgi:hypothetical protein